MARLPVATGRYWHYSVTVTTRRKNGRMEVGRREQWFPRDHSADPVLRWSRTEGKPDCRYSRHRGVPGVVPLMVATMTLKDVAALPAGEEELRKRLRALHARNRELGSGRSFEQFLPYGLGQLLTLPLRPGQRAAVLRLLAALPTTDVRGVVRDPEGRPGLEVRTEPESWRFFADLASDVLVLDQSSGEPLATSARKARAAGDVPVAVTYLPGNGWTDAYPAVPEGCRRLS
ncbi:hypothetical protein [Nonomuraea sp. NPDC049684]|uniref:hypothetical protein n=1 Tax=Nonomuraea sp. NPDC049684 TaxID=3364356 RepID=UPI0037AA4057